MLMWILALVACNTEPQTSYCEALCEWGTTCAETERTIADRDALYQDCLSQTEAQDDGCVTARTEGVNAARGVLLTECTDAIVGRQSAGECEAFTGSIDQQKSATTPGACASEGTDAQQTFSTAQSAVQETNQQVCDRFVLTFCEALDTCLVSELGEIPDAVWQQLGGTNAVDVCQSTNGVTDFADACTATELYAPEESLTDLNTARQGARECLGNFETISCEEVLNGDISILCAASFSSTQQAAAFAAGLVSLSEDVQEAVQTQ